MSIQNVREFFGRHSASATCLASLVAVLDMKASGGEDSNPVLVARLRELLAAMGAPALDDLGPQEAKGLVAELRQQFRFDSLLVERESRGTAWSYPDARLLQDIGDFSRSHAVLMSRNIVPALEGLAPRLGAPGAKMLDVGVGVAGTAMEMTREWPSLSIVGIDVWKPALALARKSVAEAKLENRIELREQGVEALEEEQAFDLAWLPTPFIPERSLVAGAKRIHAALRPGGWIIVPFINLDGLDAIPTAVWRLRVTTMGGRSWTAAELEAMLRESGFGDVHTLPRHPGVPAGFAVGRRKPS